MQNKQPPLGLKPKYIHDKLRMQEIIAAMMRYINHGKAIPAEWLDEYNTLAREYYEQ